MSNSNELFFASNWYDSVANKFKDGIELKNHNRRLKCYRNSFIANKGVDFLFELIKSKDENKTRTREQAIGLMNDFLMWGIIVKLYPTSNLNKFHDNKDLYTIGKENDEQLKTKKEPIYETISKSVNDLINNESFNKSSFKRNRSMYRSFMGKSTYNQIHSTIKKTTSSIIKSTNHNVTKFTNNTLNKLNNKSSSNLIKKLNNLSNKFTTDKLNIKSNNEKLNRSNNSIKRSTSVVYKNEQILNKPLTRSFNQSYLDKENLINVNKNFQRNYSGLSSSRSCNRNFDSNNLSFNSTTSTIRSANIINTPRLDKNFKSTFKSNDEISFNPMNEDYGLQYSVENEGKNIIQFLTKISAGFEQSKRKLAPLKQQNSTTTINSIESIGCNSINKQIILNKNHVNYIPNREPIIRQVGSYYNTLV